MKRILFVIIIAGLLILANMTGAAWAFTDTGNLSVTEAAAVEKLSAMGVIAGYPDGSFRPYSPVSRAELAKIICIYAKQDELKTPVTIFSDVPEQAWYYGWVNRASAAGWVNGYMDGSYRPQESVTQQEAIAMLLRALDIDTSSFAWPDGYIQAALGMNMFAGFDFVGQAKANRLKVCQMIYNLLKLELVAEEEKEEKEEKDSILADGLYIGVVKTVAEQKFTLWHMDVSLLLSPSIRRTPKENTLIYFTVKDKEVESWSLLLDVEQGSILSTSALKGKLVKNGPYAWAATRTGLMVEAPAELNSAKPLVRYVSYRNITVGPSSLENRNYWMGDDCQIYEVQEGKINPGSRENIELGKAVTLLVNSEEEVLVLLYWK